MDNFSIIDQLSSTGPKYVWNLRTAGDSLEQLIHYSVFAKKLRNSFNQGTDLLQLIYRAIAEAENSVPEEEANPFLFPTITETSLKEIRNEWQKLKPVLTSEIGILPTYFIDPIAAYDTDILIEDGEKLFPDVLFKLLPDLKIDAEMAGKALIFRMPTSCGFHIFRIVEAVARKYFEKLEPKVKKPKTLGWISKELDIKSLGDKKVAFALENLVEQFRNPIFHPDVSLNQDEAELLLGLANSVLVPMLNSIQQNN